MLYVPTIPITIIRTKMNDWKCHLYTFLRYFKQLNKLMHIRIFNDLLQKYCKSNLAI